MTVFLEILSNFVCVNINKKKITDMYQQQSRRYPGMVGLGSNSPNRSHHTSRPTPNTNRLTASTNHSNRPPPNTHTSRPTHNTNHTSRATPRPSSSISKEPVLAQKRASYERRARSSSRSRPISAEILITRPKGKPDLQSQESKERDLQSQESKERDLQSQKSKEGSLSSKPLQEKKNESSSIGDIDNGRSTLYLECWHIFMILANIVMMLAGIVSFVVGGWMIFDNTFAGTFIGANLYLVTVYVLLGCGCFSVSLAVMGCVGAVTAAKCVILMYIILTLAVILTMMVGALAVILCRKWTRKMTEEHMLHQLESYTVNSVIRDAWDTTQQYLHCCGVHSSEDWPKGAIPDSCCNDNQCDKKEDIYTAGCLEQTENYFDHHVGNIAAGFIGVQLVILFGLITSCGYYKALRKHRD